MPNYTCETLLRDVHIAEDLTPQIIHHILPHICGLIDHVGGNITREEMKFHNLCCDPIPTMIMNKTISSQGNSTSNDDLINDVCAYMKLEGRSGRSVGEEQIFQTYCVQNFTLPHTYLTYQLLSYTLTGLLSPIGFFANVLILLTVYKIKRLRNTTGYFICNLAIADLLVIIETILYLILYKAGAMKGVSIIVQKYLFPSFDICLGSASLLHVTAVSIERGIAVSMPLKYPRYLSNKRALHVIQVIWSFCLALFFLSLVRIWIPNPLYNKLFFYFAVTCSFFIPCILVLTSYSIIMISALKNMKMEKKISKVIVVISMIDEENLDKVILMRPARCREIKIALNVAIMTIPFVCGWGYFMISTIYEMTSNHLFEGFENWLITFLPFIVSCLNPVTYLMFTRSLRQSSWKVLTRPCMQRRNTRITHNNRRESVVTSTSMVNERPSISLPGTKEEKERFLDTI